MNQEQLIERLFQTLITGDRNETRNIINDSVGAGLTAAELMTEIYWPALNQIRELHAEDRLTRLSHNFATRALQLLIDQAQMRLPMKPRCDRTIFVVCGSSDVDELAASMAAHLVEAAGFNVSFGGGAVPADEIMAQIGAQRPDILMLYSSAASDLPEIRLMIDKLHEMAVCPDMQIVVGGGVFGRAEGLAEEIGADLYIPKMPDLVQLMADSADQRATADQRTVGRKRHGASSTSSKNAA